jgi:hypothetical protein
MLTVRIWASQITNQGNIQEVDSEEKARPNSGTLIFANVIRLSDPPGKGKIPARPTFLRKRFPFTRFHRAM